MSNIAVIELKTKQYIVEPGKLLKVDSIDEKSEFNVLFANIGNSVYVGKPYVSEVGVELDLLETKKDKKIRVSRYKSKSRYRKEKSHRQMKSLLKVVKVDNKVKNKINLKIQEDDTEARPKQEIKKEEKSKKETTKPTTDIKPEKVALKATTKSVNIDTLDITDTMKVKLHEAGYNNIEDLKGVKKEDLLSIKGFGEKAVDKLLSQIN